MKIFAERLKELRIEKGFSQSGLAKAANLNQSCIAHWELGERVPNAEAIVIFAKLFGVTSDYLLGLSDD
jgi:transcriptional regulator with XRE-family HTH domain